MCNSCTLDHTDLPSYCQPSLQRLGHRGSHIVYRANCPTLVDESSGLTLFRIEDAVLNRKSVLLVEGLPNVCAVIYRDENDPKGPGWDKFAAFMFWRQKAFVANTKGRIQAGVVLELRNLPDEARDAIRQAMKDLSGKRGASCARMNAKMLHLAGFTFGNGKSLRSFVRPSKFTSLLWRHGLKYKGEMVDVRPIDTTGRGVGDQIEGMHEDSVWGREVRSPQRMVQKQYAKHEQHAPAPVFPDREVEPHKGWTGRPVSIGINRPRWLGVKFAFLFGQQPVYTVRLDDFDQVKELQVPLVPYQNEEGTRELDFQTKVKKHVFFNPLVIWIIRYFRNKSIDWYHGIPAHAALAMLATSDSADRDAAALYNYVVILNGNGTADARFTSLKNKDPRLEKGKFRKIIAWILAKHVLVSGYDTCMVIGGENWEYWNEAADLELGVNCMSGTYQPKPYRLLAFAAYVERHFGVKVRPFFEVEGETQAA